MRQSETGKPEGKAGKNPISAGPDARLVIVPKRPLLSPPRSLALHIPGSGAQGSGYQQDWGCTGMHSIQRPQNLNQISLSTQESHESQSQGILILFIGYAESLLRHVGFSSCRAWAWGSWKRKGQPTPVFSPGKSHGHRRLAGYSP